MAGMDWAGVVGPSWLVMAGRARLGQVWPSQVGVAGVEWRGEASLVTAGNGAAGKGWPG